MLEERMETLWNKLNEKSSAFIPDSTSLTSPHTQEKTFTSKVFQNEVRKNTTLENRLARNEETSSQSDSETETESNIFIPSDKEHHEVISKPQKENIDQAFISELKHKIDKRKQNQVREVKLSDDDFTNEYPVSSKKDKLNQNKVMYEGTLSKKVDTIQKPVVKKILSKPIKESTTESDSESASDIETEKDIKEEPPKIIQKILPVKDKRIKTTKIVQKDLSKR